MYMSMATTSYGTVLASIISYNLLLLVIIQIIIHNIILHFIMKILNFLIARLLNSVIIIAIIAIITSIFIFHILLLIVIIITITKYLIKLLKIAIIVIIRNRFNCGLFTSICIFSLNYSLITSLNNRLLNYIISILYIILISMSLILKHLLVSTHLLIFEYISWSISKLNSKSIVIVINYHLLLLLTIAIIS